MRLTGDLKEKVEKVNTKEEAKEIIKDAGMILTDDELLAVSGGAFGSLSLEDIKKMWKVSPRAGFCPYCNRETEIDSMFTPWYVEGKVVEGYVCDHSDCNKPFVVIH